MEKYVITGGPCTGKTTLIDALGQRGYVVVPEAARQIIKEEQQKPNGILPMTDLFNFQKLLLQRQIDLEQRVSGDVVFLDRAFDGIAYCRLFNCPVPEEVVAFAKESRYDGVFVLDPLQYKKDDVRFEDEETAGRVHELIKEVYEDYGYELISVPVLPVEQRVDFVVNKIKETNK